MTICLDSDILQIMNEIKLNNATAREIADLLISRGTVEFTAVAVLALSTFIHRVRWGSHTQEALSRVLDAVQRVGGAVYQDRYEREKTTQK